MSGLSIATIKKNPSLIPLYACLGFGMALAVIYPLRVLLKHPEIKLAKHKNPEPWNEYADKQYKLYSVNLDYSKLKSPAPKYTDE